MKRAIITVGLGFGDEGKGATTDYLCRRYDVDGVVRYSGGSQCAHNVVLPDGRSHTFAMFGSGTLAGKPTYLGPEVIVNPGNIVREQAALEAMGVLPKLRIHPDCLVTTWFARQVNHLMEKSRDHLKNKGRHGTCGQGIGETRKYYLRYGSDAVMMRDLAHPTDLLRKLQLQRQRYLLVLEKNATILANAGLETFSLSDLSVINEFEQLRASAVSFDIWEHLPAGWNTIIFEGAQGMHLDEWVGFHPHTTWSTVTPFHAREMAALWGFNEVKTIGVTRAFTTRHGEGPLPTYDETLSNNLRDEGNPDNEWQGSLRTGWLDLPLLRYAARHCGGLDGIAVTWMDKFPDWGKVCVRYTHIADIPDPKVLDLAAREAYFKTYGNPIPHYVPMDEDSLLSAISQIAPVRCTSHGRTHMDREWIGDGVFA